MKPIYARLYSRLEEQVDDASLRADVLTTAAALAASQMGDIPSAAVESPANHYNMQVANATRQRLGQVNESIVFDLKAALNQARQFWMLRYASAHPGFLGGSDYGFFDTLMGVPRYIEPELHKFANDHKWEIFRIATDVLELLQANEGGQDV